MKNKFSINDIVVLAVKYRVRAIYAPRKKHVYYTLEEIVNSGKEDQYNIPEKMLKLAKDK